ncbi:hypothetical protein ACLB9X_32690 [Streptomyces sp. 5K101]|uniref:hypothetical protein n=1 Tax=Streptomyces sp. 5K101 TaxID=3390037 RepID=UPI0039762A17
MRFQSSSVVRRRMRRSQCLVVGDDQPYIAALVTVDPEAPAYGQSLKGKQPADVSATTDDEDLRA